MTTHDVPPPPPPGPPPPRSRALRRSADDRMVAGVAGGLGRWLDIDPVLVRVTFAVLAVFGGVGIALYLVLWLLMPEPGAESSALERWLSSRSGDRSWVAVALLVVLVAIVAVRSTDAAVVIAVIAAIALLATRSHQPVTAGSPAAPPAAGSPASPEAPAYSTFAGPVTGEEATVAYGPQAEPYPEPYAAPPTPVPPRPRRLGVSRHVLGATAVAGGLVWLLDRLGAVSPTPTQGLGVVLAVLAVGLIAGSFVGRGWLAAGVGVLLALALVASAAVTDATGSTRSRSWQPTAATLAPSYHLDAGHATLDLTGAGPLAGQRVRVSLGAGDLVVVVPRGVPVLVDADAGVGDLSVLGEHHSGINPRDSTVDPGYTEATGLALDLHVGAGQVEVRRG